MANKIDVQEMVPFSRVTENVQQEIAMRLDPAGLGGLANWRNVADKLGFDQKFIDWIPEIQYRDFPTNALKLFKCYRQYRTSSVQEFVIALHNVGRDDVITILKDAFPGVDFDHIIASGWEGLPYSTNPDNSINNATLFHNEEQCDSGPNTRTQVSCTGHPESPTHQYFHHLPQSPTQTDRHGPYCNQMEAFSNSEYTESISLVNHYDHMDHRSTVPSVGDYEMDSLEATHNNSVAFVEDVLMRPHVMAEVEVHTSEHHTNELHPMDYERMLHKPLQLNINGGRHTSLGARPKHIPPGGERPKDIPPGGARPKSSTPAGHIQGNLSNGYSQSMTINGQCNGDIPEHRNPYRSIPHRNVQNSTPQVYTTDNTTVSTWPLRSSSNKGAPSPDSTMHCRSVSVPSDNCPNQFHLQARPVRVMITYVKETPKHEKRVIDLADCLLKNKFMVTLDKKEEDFVKGDMHHWIMSRFNKVNYVLVVIGQKYKQVVEKNNNCQLYLESTDCARLIYTQMAEELRNIQRSTRFIVLIFPGAAHTPEFVPQCLINCTHYPWPREWKDVMWFLSNPQNHVRKCAHQQSIRPYPGHTDNRAVAQYIHREPHTKKQATGNNKAGLSIEKTPWTDQK